MFKLKNILAAGFAVLLLSELLAGTCCASLLSVPGASPSISDVRDDDLPPSQNQVEQLHESIGLPSAKGAVSQASPSLMFLEICKPDYRLTATGIVYIQKWMWFPKPPPDELLKVPLKEFCI